MWDDINTEEDSMFKKIIYLLVFLVLLTSTVYASFRCGHGLVQIGDTKYEVISLCGEPIARETIGYIRKGMCGLKIEELIYKIGSVHYYLKFIGNRLIKIESKRH